MILFEIIGRKEYHQFNLFPPQDSLSLPQAQLDKECALSSAFVTPTTVVLSIAQRCTPSYIPFGPVILLLVYWEPGEERRGRRGKGRNGVVCFHLKLWGRRGMGRGGERGGRRGWKRGGRREGGGGFCLGLGGGGCLRLHFLLLLLLLLHTLLLLFLLLLLLQVLSPLFLLLFLLLFPQAFLVHLPHSLCELLLPPLLLLRRKRRKKMIRKEEKKKKKKPKKLGEGREQLRGRKRKEDVGGVRKK